MEGPHQHTELPQTYKSPQPPFSLYSHPLHTSPSLSPPGLSPPALSPCTRTQGILVSLTVPVARPRTRVLLLHGQTLSFPAHANSGPRAPPPQTTPLRLSVSHPLRAPELSAGGGVTRTVCTVMCGRSLPLVHAEGALSAQILVIKMRWYSHLILECYESL